MVCKLTKCRMIDIGLTLRKLRDKNKFTQQHVANCVEISRVSYRKWENNEVDFCISQLSKIAKLYEVPIHEIFIQSDFNK
ncbi:helix-turn-helix transcriptional regulator [Pedobacter sp. MW01-1-1]|uniref:helix-turn-helix transcriptional regulator n=1 Tax=Pedobacter sp. MW01-1-1 TaxID=3383027 RepID=UPI003FED619A